ncbi:ATP-dependent DNA helicase PIF1-like [Sitodiplosis mosellana]|uniref:ATP-dependent DNA helicase PIF1-like n=1 Tax=Sitodiplosis mosellana TaxID=263140 RepID=UPI002444CD74|nr:ATP-dependent DNA helicase PIF1-like [Sitodiplosis mosellana]
MHLSEDFLRDFDDETSFNRALLEIEQIFIAHNVTCAALGLPTPLAVQDVNNVDTFDPFEAQFLYEELYQSANVEQRNIIDRVIREVTHRDTGSNVFCLTAHAGCGKTFTQTAIIHRLHSLNLRCIATAFSGIASTLLIGGRTLHNAFKLPIPILDTSVANVVPNSVHGRYINHASLILIDEISMCPLQVLKIIDRLLRDLCESTEDKNKLFAGKTILLCGDFRQILPVIPHGSRATLIENCVTSWDAFASFHKVTLTQNMRALPDEIAFVEFLKKIGNGEATQYPQFGDNTVEIPPELVGELKNIIPEIYGNISENILSERIISSVVLAPTNDDCSLINTDVLQRLPGEEKESKYFSGFSERHKNES